jgi:hypothetical protein
MTGRASARDERDSNPALLGLKGRPARFGSGGEPASSCIAFRDTVAP